MIIDKQYYNWLKDHCKKGFFVTTSKEFRTFRQKLKQNAVDRMKTSALYQIYWTAPFCFDFGDCIVYNFDMFPNELTSKECSIAEVMYISALTNIHAVRVYNRMAEMFEQRTKPEVYNEFIATTPEPKSYTPYIILKKYELKENEEYFNKLHPFLADD